jgi:hypothetical protein
MSLEIKNEKSVINIQIYAFLNDFQYNKNGKHVINVREIIFCPQFADYSMFLTERAEDDSSIDCSRKKGI